MSCSKSVRIYFEVRAEFEFESFLRRKFIGIELSLRALCNKMMLEIGDKP